jgi:hypothetical protein
MLGALLVLLVQPNLRTTAPVYTWLEAERMDGVSGHYGSWQAETPKPGWHWNGPGVAAEWGQGGESSFNSISCGAKADAAARATTTLRVPHAGRYRLWIRHGEWRDGATPVSVHMGKAFSGAVGMKPTLDAQDEALAYWGWTFVWGHVDAPLPEGEVGLWLGCELPALERRIVDALMLTDDLEWQPQGRARPPFGYTRALADWRAHADAVPPGPRWNADPAQAPHPFVVPWNVRAESFEPGMPPFFVEQPLRKAFVAAYRGKPIPIFASTLLAPVVALDSLPKLLATQSPLRRWLESTHRPFYTLWNYQNAPWRNDAAARAQVAADRAALAALDRGDISGENIGYLWHVHADEVTHAVENADNRAHVLRALRALYEPALTRKLDALGETTPAPWRKLITALSAGSNAWVHALAEWGSGSVGLETAAGMPNFAARIAFARGAARQFGRDYLYYHAPNFGDTASTFTATQNLGGPAAWFHTRYGLVFGPSIAWYRKSLFLEWLGGAGAIYFEQGYDQFFQPGPGAHPVELTPIGRVTDAFLRFASAHVDRGEPVAPVALLLDPAHGWDDTLYQPRAWNLDGDADVLKPNAADQSITQTLDALYYPNALVQGEPATAERQAFVHAMLGDGVDVLTATENAPVMRYRVLALAGRVDVPQLLVRRIDAATRAGRLELLLPRGSAPALEPLCGRPHVVCASAELGLAEDGSCAPEWAVALASAAWAAAPVHVSGDIEWSVNRTRRGYWVTLTNSRGNDKPQQGLAIAPHREQFADVTVESRGLARARELLGPGALAIESGRRVRLRVPAGAMRLVELELQ